MIKSKSKAGENHIVERIHITYIGLGSKMLFVVGGTITPGALNQKITIKRLALPHI